MGKTIISAKDIRKAYRDLKVLKGVDITINESEIISIVGASGAGKTTLLLILGTRNLFGVNYWPKFTKCAIFWPKITYIKNYFVEC